MSHPALFPRIAPLLTVAAFVAACGSPATPGGSAPAQPVTLAPKVDLPRYMGDWYVIASIPTSLEDGGYNAKESYRLEPDGRIAITFTFNDGGFAGPLKTYHSTGSVPDARTPAIWDVQFVWPVKADYRISYLASDYSQVVVTREKRDYVWIMARTPTIADADYQRLAAIVAREGYDPKKLKRVLQASGK